MWKRLARWLFDIGVDEFARAALWWAIGKWTAVAAVLTAVVSVVASLMHRPISLQSGLLIFVFGVMSLVLIHVLRRPTSLSAAADVLAPVVIERLEIAGLALKPTNVRRQNADDQEWTLRIDAKHGPPGGFVVTGTQSELEAPLARFAVAFPDPIFTLIASSPRKRALSNRQ